MKTVTLSAIFDGQHIRLEEPYAFPLHARLLVTVLPAETDHEREEVLRLAANGLARSYGDDEPDYSNVVVEEPNPNYEAR